MLGIITNHEILENMEANPQQVVLILDILNYFKIKIKIFLDNFSYILAVSLFNSFISYVNMFK